MKQPEYVYLDLDRTLIDTPTVTATLFAACEQLYGIKQDVLQDEILEYYHDVGTLRYHDFFGQLAAHGIDPAAAREDLLATINEDFIYPDAHDMLRFLAAGPYKLHVLSFGKHDFQQFKYALAPQLHAIPFTSILYDKAQFLQNMQGDGSVMLIDDKLTTPLPARTLQLQIKRDATADIQKLDDSHTVIRSLESVQAILSEKMRYNNYDSKGTPT